MLLVTLAHSLFQSKEYSEYDVDERASEYILDSDTAEVGGGLEPDRQQGACFWNAMCGPRQADRTYRITSCHDSNGKSSKRVPDSLQVSL